MSIIFNVLFITLIVSCVFRHVTNTISIISEVHEKRKNKRFEKFNK